MRRSITLISALLLALVSAKAQPNEDYGWDEGNSMDDGSGGDGGYGWDDGWDDDQSYVGTWCKVDSTVGMCLMVSDRGCGLGQFTPNYCPGSTNVQCCTPPKNVQGGCPGEPSAPSNSTSIPSPSGTTHPKPKPPPSSPTPSPNPDPSPSPNPSPSKTTSGGSSSPTGSHGPLATISHPRLKGAQAVVSGAFAPKLQAMIDCLPKGDSSAIFITSSSRCGASPSSGYTPVGPNGISMHQLGHAVDINLINPDGSMCNGDCLQAAYRGKGSRRAKRASGTGWVSTFMSCVESKGVEVGAGYASPDPVHFAVKPPGDWSSIRTNYRVSLKQFCQGSIGNVKKLNPSESACSCDGYGG